MVNVPRRHASDPDVIGQTVGPVNFLRDVVHSSHQQRDDPGRERLWLARLSEPARRPAPRDDGVLLTLDHVPRSAPSDLPPRSTARWSRRGRGPYQRRISVGSSRRRGLADTVQQFLTSQGIVELEHAAVIGGQQIDLLFTVTGCSIAVLVDTGPLPGRDPARRLRLMRQRARPPPCGRGAKASSIRRVLRIPA
ncbi:hypothetical protein [Streptomyces sp. NPDC004296]|uniref:hypothetical protein n=1 Tax=Streptomyces sp. NPDC004296 TaxID=3364697 RepID=UPI0036A6617B